MTTNLLFNTLMSLVNDLSCQLPSQQRYQHLLETLRALFPCDACALLRREQNYLVPLAINGLSEDTLGRRFLISEQPRLAMILEAHGSIRFPADSPLPDPYDGLIDKSEAQLNVHDCMGVTLYIDDQAWGVLTFDALIPGTFDSINQQMLQTFIGLTEATVKVANLIVSLESRVKQAEQSLLEETHRLDMIGNSVQMQALNHEISVVAPSDLSVLILGETGVGKELVAHQIHALSKRAEQAMIYVNCAALPENIAESELFGHSKGAFSGATADRTGKFELANEGTIFLDEIGDLPLALQGKILRTLQNGEIQRVGSDRYIKVNIRVIAATNRNLQKGVVEGHFRPDLYHRLAVYPISVPPLRERGKDVLLISGLFLEKNKQRLGVQGLRLDETAKQMLLTYQWPGNIRELEHLLSRAALKAVAEEGGQKRVLTIYCQHLDIIDEVSSSPPSFDEPAFQLPSTQKNLKRQVDEFKKHLISQKLNENQGNCAKTAQMLGLDRGNFHRLLKRLQIESF
ncbi:MAG: nitric oxide reductase transcriptional regulator NorR [Methylococcales bacterium]|nr:nitric oxide reductase transcriptional regulator NorR [Methylococcales bacterium]